MDLEQIRTFTPWVFATISIIWTVLWLVINKTYATKKEISELRNRHERLEAKVNELPSHQELAELRLNMERLNGHISEIRPQLTSLHKMSDLLIENELKEH